MTMQEMSGDNALWFMDAEFEMRGGLPVIISVGLVSFSGDETIYEEFVAPDGGYRSNFVVDTVVPLLTGKCIITSGEATGKHASRLSGATIIVDSEIDGGIAATLFPRSVVEVIETNGIDEESAYRDAYEDTLDPVMRPAHHALNDAFAVRAGYFALVRKRQ